MSRAPSSLDPGESEVSRICAALDVEVDAFRSWPFVE
jgi:hypothetical protein